MSIQSWLVYTVYNVAVSITITSFVCRVGW